VLLSPEELTLDDLVTDPTLEEVWINGPNQFFVAGGLESVVASGHLLFLP